MDDRRRTLAAITLIVGFFLIVAIIIGVLVSGKKVLSPIPDDPTIKIMFITPTPLSVDSSTSLTPSPATPKISPMDTPEAQ